MSLWGATVITNLLSAIPWIGVDFVEFVSPHFIENLFKIIGENWLEVSSFLYSFYILLSLSTIGIIRTRALRGAKVRTDTVKFYALKIPYVFLAMFVGLVDGDVILL
jgi:quinol-cytochrome oxidoreductase complex cytochrome b subunit